MIFMVTYTNTDEKLIVKVLVLVTLFLHIKNQNKRLNLSYFLMTQRAKYILATSRIGHILYIFNSHSCINNCNRNLPKAKYNLGIKIDILSLFMKLQTLWNTFLLVQEKKP